MIDEVAQWKQRIIERKAKGQTITDWCTEHNVTKGSYQYWRRKVTEATTDTITTNTESITFAKLKTTSLIKPSLQVTWQDVSIQLSNNQEAHIAAEVIACLRKL